jgi:fibulin 1/2
MILILVNDLCLVNNGNCEQLCTLVKGFVSCSCRSGYVNSNETHCTDLDECSSNNGGCEQHCHNTIGSYHCSCNSEYIINSDGHRCDGNNTESIIIIIN